MISNNKAVLFAASQLIGMVSPAKCRGAISEDKASELLDERSRQEKESLLFLSLLPMRHQISPEPLSWKPLGFQRPSACLPTRGKFPRNVISVSAIAGPSSLS